MPTSACRNDQIRRELLKDRHRTRIANVKVAGDVATAGQEKEAVRSNSLRIQSRNDEILDHAGTRFTSITEQSNVPSPSKIIFYPAYCHSASPTWFTWVKLTAVDIHKTLEVRDGYQHTLQVGYKSPRYTPMVLFFLNHPIQFVQVIGVVVNLETYFEKFWLFTIDDSSGATIDVVCGKPTTKTHGANAFDTAIKSDMERSDDAESNDEEQRLIELNERIAQDVIIGNMLQVKGTITQFQHRKSPMVLEDIGVTGRALTGSTMRPQRSVDTDKPIRQISLVRLQVVPSTSVELSLIDARTKFYASVLSKPWILSPQRVKRLRRKAFGETEQVRKKSERTVRRQVQTAEEEARDARLIQMEYDQDEVQRHQVAELARKSGEGWANHKTCQIQNAASDPQGKPIEMDEKTALLRAAFG